MKTTRLQFLASLSALLFCFSLKAEDSPPPPDTAKLDLERRVQRLEETLNAPRARLGPASIEESETDQEPEPIAAPNKSAVPPAGWQDGFFLQSADKAYYLRLTGQIQADYRTFGDHNDVKDIDTFLVRRARLGVEATVFQYYEFRLLPDFGQGLTRIQDSYVNVHYVDYFQVTAGKFKEPVSYEELIQDRFVPTMERSILDQIIPARDVGIMIHGQKLLDDRLDYAIGIFNGEINGGSTPTTGDFNTNNRMDAAARVAVRPFNCESFPELTRGLQVGVSGTWGSEREPILPLTLRTPGTVPWLQFNKDVVLYGTRTRITPEFAYFYKSFGFAAQYLRENEEAKPSITSTTMVNIPYEGYYFMATYLLTGEERTSWSQMIVPLRAFEPHHPFTCPGAWELVARISRLRLDESIFDPGPTQLVNPANFTPSAVETTLGFNWYLNAWVRMQFNWEHAMFQHRVNLGPGAFLNVQDTFLTRLQVIF